MSDGSPYSKGRVETTAAEIEEKMQTWTPQAARPHNGLGKVESMPPQEVFLREEAGGRVIEVLKTYDPAYAREVFEGMDNDAQALLWSSLEIEQVYDPADLPLRPRRFPLGRTRELRSRGCAAQSQPAVIFRCKRNPRRCAAKPVRFC
jgi:hypothetical protein